MFISFPVALSLFGLVDVIRRSLVIGSVMGLVAFVASAWSNVRFFRAIQLRKAGNSNEQAVPVTEIRAAQVWDKEPLDSYGPALVFFADGGKALLLVGQWYRERSDRMLHETTTSESSV